MRLLALALVALFLAAPADAQFRRDKRFAKQGDVALVATIRGLDVLQIDQALGGIGLRYRLADQTVLGVSVGGDASSDDQGGTVGGGGFDRTTTNVQTSLWLEQHLGRSRRALSPFVGLGAQVLRHRSEVESSRTFDPCGDRTQCDVVTQTQQQTVSRWRVGAAALVGAEVRLAGGVTLGGAYSFGGGYETTENRQEVFDHRATPNENVDRQSSDRYFIGTGVTEVLLSVYF